MSQENSSPERGPQQNPPAPAGEPGIPADAVAEPDAVVDVPLNRAARRGRGKAPTPVPGHVGPRSSDTRAARPQRSYTKRRSG